MAVKNEKYLRMTSQSRIPVDTVKYYTGSETLHHQDKIPEHVNILFSGVR